MFAMKPERWQRVEELFHAALERGPDRRIAFLDEICSGDLELRRDVEVLLASLAEADDFIEEPPLNGAISSLVERMSGEAGPKSEERRSLIGHRVGHYEIQSLLGTGGMGEVYLARDLTLDRPIAVKILPAQFTRDKAQVQRFEREARAASGLNHPNILTIHEVGRDEGVHFIATEFVDGQTLREKISSGRMSLEDAVSVAIQVADALSAAHGAGIVHRDIKPENVMIRPDGLVKVLDFGLAKTVDRQVVSVDPPASAFSLRTDPDVLMGTIAYLSPEQVRRGPVDRRTDIFSLGVLLYEMITGVRPFTGDSPSAILRAILSDERPASRMDTPEPLKSIIGRALEKDRDARYATADAMRDDLQRSISETAERQMGASRRWRTGLAAGVGGLAILALVVSVTRREGISSQPPPFSTGAIRRVTDTPGQEIFPCLSPDGQAVVYASRASGDWDIYFQRTSESKAANLTAGSRYVDLEPALSPDGARIAFRSSREGAGIFLMDTDGNNLTKLTAEGHNPTWSPDAREIACAEDRVFDYEGRNSNLSRLFAIDVRTGARRMITDHDAVQPSWSPHGDRIAFWGVHKGAQRDIWTVSSHGGEPVAVTDDAAVDWNPVWSRDGKYLYLLSNRGGSMNLWRAPIDEVTGKLTGALEPATLPSTNSQHLSFSGDGLSLAYVDMNRRENTWEVNLDPAAGKVIGEPSQITQGARRYTSPEVSPDEKSLVFFSGGETQEDIFILNRESDEIRQLTNDPAQDRWPRWSPDGRQIVFMSDRGGKYEIWTVNGDGTRLAQLTDRPSEDVFSPVWSPEGKRVLCRVRNVGPVVVHLDGSSPATEPLASRDSPGFVPWSWSPDGRLIAGWRINPEGPDSQIVIFSLADHRYLDLPDHGLNPIWLNDSRRLIFSSLNSLYLLDLTTRQTRLLHSGGTSNFGVFSLSRDNRRLYYSLVSSEADIYVLSVN